MKILITEWAARNYSPAPSPAQLKSWIKTGQIFPAPEKVGRNWMVDENSSRMPNVILADIEHLSERARTILKSI